MKRTLTLSIVLIAWFLLSPAYSAPAEMGPVPEASETTQAPKVSVPFNIENLKRNWRSRILALKEKGVLPLVDIESSYSPNKLDARLFARMMDEQGVALLAFSPEVGGKEVKEGKLWSDHPRRLISVDPWRYIPTTTAGIHPAWTEKPGEFLDEQIQHAKKEAYPLLGEFEFRHYPSPRQIKRGESFRDVAIPINGPHGRRLFAFAQESGIPFQIHYEIEDGLLAPLEEMLKEFPGAKVIWCHLAQIRYQKRSKEYGPEYVETLLKKYPNIYFDLAFGGPDSEYPGSGELHARVWENSLGRVKPGWVKVISENPWRFLAALDLGGDRMDDLPKPVRTLRLFLESLSPEVREIVGYKAPWKMLFDESL